MTKYTCEHCKTTFTAQSSLSRHKRRARYCVQGRGLETKDQTCVCGKQFIRNDTLQRHKEICVIFNNGPQTSLQKETEANGEEFMLKFMEKYENMVKEFQKQITELSLRPTKITNNNSNNNNVLNNLQPITEEGIQEHLDSLTIDFIQEGGKGYADFAGNYPFKDKVLCTDRSRKKLRYRGPDGELTDNGRALVQRFFQAISERNTEILNRAYADLHHQMEDIVARGRAGDEDVTGILTRATELQDILLKSQEAARGQENELTKEFINHLTKNC